MTVEEMIEVLRKMDQKAPIVVLTDNGSYGFKVYENKINHTVVVRTVAT